MDQLIAGVIGAASGIGGAGLMWRILNSKIDKKMDAETCHRIHENLDAMATRIEASVKAMESSRANMMTEKMHAAICGQQQAITQNLLLKMKDEIIAAVKKNGK